MRKRRTFVFIVVLLVIAALGAWRWMAWKNAGKPEDEVVQKASELDSAYKQAGGKAVDDETQAERLEDQDPAADTEPTRGPMKPND
ncbi:MAG: hypothetical protein R3B57_01705 [Phycisphaerales bacterium]